jgi:O-antigen ligase
VLSGLVLAAVVVRSPYAAIFVTLGLFVFLIFFKSPLKALSILIIIIPFSGTTLFKYPVINVPGAKPLIFLALFVLIIAMINYEQSLRMPRYALVFIVVLVAVFTITVLHSLKNLDNYNLRMLNEGRKEFSAFAYILQSYVRPLIYFIPLLIIIKFAKKLRDLEFIMNTMVLSLLALSVCILYLYIFKVPKGKWEMANHVVFGPTMGMLRNSLANFFIIGFPAILARYFLRKNVFSIICICLSVAAVGFLFSRTAYVILILSFVFYLMISKRTKYLPLLFAIGIGVSFIMSANIIERASKGIDSGDRNKISAGRTDNTWLPLIEEYTQDPQKLLIGNGRYAIVSSKAVIQGYAPDDFWHPHNMYLELIIDSGLVGFMCVVPLFVLILRKIHKNLGTVRDLKIREYHYAVIVSMISYFVAGITGRSFFPGLKNSYLWIIIGIGIAMLQIRETSGEQNDST